VNSSTSFSLVQSGAPFVVPNHLVDATSISIAYVIAGAPLTMRIVVEGIKNASGAVAVLDSYVGTSNVSRSITLSDTYDRFKITAYWSGGKGVSLAATLTSTGAGPTFSTTSLSAVQSHSF